MVTHLDDASKDEMENIQITNAVMLNNPKSIIPWCKVVYVDTPKLLAFDLFERRNLHPWGFRKMDNAELPYVGVGCRVWKRELPTFLETMHELRKLILMCGHNNYDDFCAEIFKDNEPEGNPDE